jgi:mannitol/fructose-specific phosphotransferase system IIA component (Ntr-type)
MLLSDRLKPGAIDLRMAGGTLEAVISELAELAVSSMDGEKKYSSQIKENLLRRERMLSTAMGVGVAFPHCTSSHVREPAFALGISRAGIDGDAPDSKPVQIFFVVISPEKDPNAHLEALAAASRVFMDSTTREAVLSAGTPQEVIEAIAVAERKFA